MGHGPIGAVKFQAAFIKQAVGSAWARDVLRLTGFIWAGTGQSRVQGAAHWAPGVGRGALDAAHSANFDEKVHKLQSWCDNFYYVETRLETVNKKGKIVKKKAKNLSNNSQIELVSYY